MSLCQNCKKRPICQDKPCKAVEELLKQDTSFIRESHEYIEGPEPDSVSRTEATIKPTKPEVYIDPPTGKPTDQILPIPTFLEIVNAVLNEYPEIKLKKTGKALLQYLSELLFKRP